MVEANDNVQKLVVHGRSIDAMNSAWIEFSEDLQQIPRASQNAVSQRDRI